GWHIYPLRKISEWRQWKSSNSSIESNFRMGPMEANNFINIDRLCLL
ncbi:27763_t:CDS:1, partial [Racocetra persica]